MSENYYMLNLNEKCLLNFLRDCKSENAEKSNNLISLLDAFGVKIKKNNYNSDVVEIIEEYEKIH